MSNIGKLKIKVPQGVTLTLESTQITVEGKLGKIVQPISGDVIFISDNNTLSSNSSNKVLWGTENRNIANAIIGVSQGFKKRLNLVGIGYRAQVIGKLLTLKLGLSHDVKYQIPDEIEIICPKPDQIILLGIKKDYLNRIASNIRSFKKPDPYKGKGILFENERLILKEGKKK
jgi:large subunit ribosomal protein L6